jgi:hypothetical protein
MTFLFKEMDSTVLYLLTPRRLLSFLTAALPDINRLLEVNLRLRFKRSLVALVESFISRNLLSSRAQVTLSQT